MNILGVQKNHNISVCLFSNENLIYYNQEERLSKIKHDSFFPLHCFNEIEKLNIKIDKVICTGYDTVDSNIIYGYLYKKKIIKSIKDSYHYYKTHHFMHAVKSYISSNMKQALIIVADGRGSTYYLDNGEQGYETTSVYYVDDISNFKCVYKKILTTKEGHKAKVKTNNIYGNFYKKQPLSIDENTKFDVDYQPHLGAFYTRMTSHLGFKNLDEGKLMGLQAYGNNNTEIKKNLLQQDLFNNEDNNNPNYNIDYNKYPNLYNKEKNCDIAFETQNIFEEQMFDLISRYKDKYSNIILTGGCGLNVVFNYKLRKKLSNDINLYVDPLCGDEGNSIGAALTFYKNCANKVDWNNIYLGSEPNYNFESSNNEIEEVVENLINKKIIALYQGRAEAGPRALGNRSLLLDPRLSNGKTIMNEVKQREWFRPFGASILEEEAYKWFDMAGLKQSPYMLYAVQALDGVKEKIPSIIHVDNTCRIQTVSKEQNLILYKILKIFYEKTGVPILMNTSFNLAGETLVETPEDAINTFNRSRIDCLYFADLNKLISKLD